MAIEFKKAHRSKAKLRLAIAGPSGAGKTYSALLIASGIVPLEKVAVIDTESGSADLYADLGGYSTVTINPPYSPQKYIEAIRAQKRMDLSLSSLIVYLTHGVERAACLTNKERRRKANTAEIAGRHGVKSHRSIINW